MQCQEGINLDDLIISTNEIEHFSGQLSLKENQVFFESSDCFLKGNTLSLEVNNNGKLKLKKWQRKLRENNGFLKNVVVKGVLSQDKSLITVDKIDKPLNTPKRWSKGTSGLYLDSAVELYRKTIDLRENYRVFSISVEEVEDPNLGSVTEYTIYDKKCNKLGPEEIKKISSEELSALNASIKLGGKLLIKQALLIELSDQSSEEIKRLSTFNKITPTKDAATAGIFHGAILAQLPKIIKNLRASKQYIEQLQSE